MNKKQFIEMISRELKEYGAKLHVTKYKRIFDGHTHFSGMFSEDCMEIRVAGKNPEWFKVLVHEYAHFIQWKTKCKLWNGSGDSSSVFFDDWLFGNKKLRRKTVERHFKNIRNLELDCEQRTVDLIKKYKLPINIPEYIQDANSYIYTYAYVFKYRTWPPKTYLPTLKRIRKTLPTKFLKEAEYNTVPKKYEEMVNRLRFDKNNEGNHYWDNEKNWVKL